MDRLSEIKGRYQAAVSDLGCPDGKMDQDCWEDSVASEIDVGPCRTFTEAAPQDIAYLVGEVERLRGALESIANCEGDEPAGNSCTCPDIASASLEATKTT